MSASMSTATCSATDNLGVAACQQDQVTAVAGLKSALKRADALAAAKADEVQTAIAEAAATRERTR
jgi:hypothetical protein